MVDIQPRQDAGATRLEFTCIHDEDIVRSIPFTILAFAEGPTWCVIHASSYSLGDDILNLYLCVYGFMSCVCVHFILNKDTLF